MGANGREHGINQKGRCVEQIPNFLLREFPAWAGKAPGTSAHTQESKAVMEKTSIEKYSRVSLASWVHLDFSIVQWLAAQAVNLLL